MFFRCLGFTAFFQNPCLQTHHNSYFFQFFQCKVQTQTVGSAVTHLPSFFACQTLVGSHARFLIVSYRMLKLYLWRRSLGWEVLWKGCEAEKYKREAKGTSWYTRRYKKIQEKYKKFYKKSLCGSRRIWLTYHIPFGFFSSIKGLYKKDVRFASSIPKIGPNH